MVEKHIKSLLYDHDCVIIPDFGGLIARYVPARINPVKHTFSPPSKKIAFNEKLVLNDGLLISTIAHHDHITKDEAQQRVAEFVHNAKTNLHAEKRFELRDIGVFRYNAERRLVFEYAEAENMLEASFGLPELSARPVKVEEPAVLRTLIKERQQELVEERQPLRRRIKRAYNVAAGLALAGLSVSAFYFLSLQADYNLSSLNPMTVFTAAGYTAPATVEPNRYTQDYVPFTEEDRLSYYATILPEASQNANEVANAYEPSGASVALGAAADDFVTEEVAEETVGAVEDVEPEAPAHIIYTKDGRSYIISGGYARLENAEQYRTTLMEQGHEEVDILLPQPGSRLFRVALADFPTAEEAQVALNTYREKFGETLWVLNN
ncbi:SPOR domain-containing protein [Pontibacter anaerobius]|uniref:SPOR domain-containing protein n=1 Tax=Pontibacter anaerobius TaxID=2993940 RepID=A0ABT3RCD2_9BACT|nr:SPOR domain-containing protein [Pontibacter anaerobius]MCX2739185.1 SPOR domain-containing protein [Pontibacter anaerobius]